MQNEAINHIQYLQGILFKTAVSAAKVASTRVRQHNQVVLVADTVTPRVAKHGYALASCGMEVILLYHLIMLCEKTILRKLTNMDTLLKLY